MLSPIELQPRLDTMERWRRVGQNCEKLERGGDGNPGAPNVGRVADAERDCHVSDLLRFAEPTCGACVRLHDVDGTRGEYLSEAVSSEFAFASRDRDRERVFHLAVTRKVLRRHRLLKPTDVEVLDPAAKPDSRDRVVGMVSVDH